MNEKEMIDILVDRIKSTLETEHNVSVMEVLSDFRDEQQEIDPNFELRITNIIIEKASMAVLKDSHYYREKDGKDSVIALDPNYKAKSWYEKHPVLYDIFKGLLTAIFSLTVGWLLLQSKYQAQDQKYKELKLQLEQATYKIDSLTNARSYQKKK